MTEHAYRRRLWLAVLTVALVAIALLYLMYCRASVGPTQMVVPAGWKA